MRLIFMGSPDEVIAPLRTLRQHCQTSTDELVAVISQPAKPAGRKQTLTDPPLAAFAKAEGLHCLQPVKASDPAFLDELKALEPDVIITAAYGQILSNAFLAIPKRATINIHPSLLPAYRGAIPVPAALLDGLDETGVSILFTVKALDAGAIIEQATYTILPNETAAQLTPRLFAEGGTLLLKALDRLRDPAFTGQPQDESHVTHCRKIAKTDGHIDWQKSAAEISHAFRAYQPWPGTYTGFKDQRVVIEELELLNDLPRLAPGSFVYDKRVKRLIVGTGDQSVAVARLKSAGSKSVDAASFWNGLKLSGEGQFERSEG